jgi:hypothetical protein
LQHAAFDLVRDAVRVDHLAAIMACADSGHANVARLLVHFDFGDGSHIGDRVVVAQI